MLVKLENGILINPITEQEAIRSSTKRIIYSGIQETLNRNNLDHKQIKQWLHETLKEEKKQEDRRDNAHKETRSLIEKIVFHKILPGNLLSGSTRPKMIEITEPFEMMQTLMTQYMWAQIKITMGERAPEKINPSHFKTGIESQIINIDDINVQMKPNHPAESITFFEMIEFIDLLNDLSKTGDDKTQESLSVYFPGHQKGDLYKLPTDEQWQYVASGGGQHNKSDNYVNLDTRDFAWSEENSNNQTHAVAQKIPLRINDDEFYDMFGNVWERTIDSRGESNVRGGSWDFHSTHIKSAHGRMVDDIKFNNVGFRLVRIRR